MQLTIDRQQLISAVQDVLKAISSRNVIPILSGIKFETKQDGVLLTGSDSHISIERFIPKEENDVQYITIEQQGSIILPAQYFSEIIRKLPESTLAIKVNDNFLTTIQSGKSEFNLNGLDPNEYPRLPKIEKQYAFQIKAKHLKEVLQQTVFAVSTSETRPVLTGVNWSYKNNQLYCVATDSHRLAQRYITIDETENDVEQLSFENVIVPGKSLQELLKIISDDVEMIGIVITSNHILFKLEHTLFYSRLLEGNYPDVSKLIPTESTTNLVVETKTFLDAIDRASLLARENSNHIVKLVNLTDNQLEISSNSPEIGKVQEQMLPSSFEGEELNLSFSAKYMLDALRSIQSKEVSIDFTGAMRPFLLRPVDDRSLLQLILPVRTY